MKITLTKTQYNALDHIYGRPENVHYLIMCAKPTDKGWILEGSDETFNELLEIINEEICEVRCSQKRAKSLIAVCKKVDPKSLDWMGF